MTAFAAGGCGGDDEQQAAVTPADLLASLPTANELGHKPFQEYEWENATDMIVEGPVIPEDTSLEDLAAELADAGFQAPPARVREPRRRAERPHCRGPVRLDGGRDSGPGPNA